MNTNLSSTTLVDCETPFSNFERDQLVPSKKLLVIPGDTVTLPLTNKKDYECRHGISRYAPYGTRFAARMKCGQYKTSHISGDLADRARQKNGRGGRVDLILAIHDGERHQLDSALEYYKLTLTAPGLNPGPSEVLQFLKDNGCDWDYRKANGEKLMQRNASNFFKRMTEHSSRLCNTIGAHKDLRSIAIRPANLDAPESIDFDFNTCDKDLTEAAAILSQLIHVRNNSKLELASPPTASESESHDDVIMTDDNISGPQSDSHKESLSPFVSETIQDKKIDDESIFNGSSLSSTMSKKRKVDWSLPPHHVGSFHYELCIHLAAAIKDEQEHFSKAAENFDWSSVPKSPVLKAHEPYNPKSYSPEWRQTKKLKINHPKKIQSKLMLPQNKLLIVTQSNLPATTHQSIHTSSGIKIKGLSRHSPYGTRFCAQMPSGEMCESYLAGDLGNRARSANGKSHGALILVPHAGEIEQLEKSWEFVKSMALQQIGAGCVLEFLQSLDLDCNHRKTGTKLLQKNAGNFFKRVQEFGKRRINDPSYLSLSG